MKEATVKILKDVLKDGSDLCGDHKMFAMSTLVTKKIFDLFFIFSNKKMKNVKKKIQSVGLVWGAS